MKEYKWEKISIIGHSLGGYIAFFFAAIFPNKVDKIISIDALKPSVYTSKRLVHALQQTIENFPIADQRNVEGDLIEYTYNEMIDKIYNGFLNSVSKEAAPYILRRGALPSKKQPGKYYFSRDGRLRYNFGFYLGHSMYIDLATQFKLPYLIIKAAKFPIAEDHDYFNETLSVMKTNPNFEYHEIDTFSHHLHLTEPERIVGIIEDFMENYKKVESHLWENLYFFNKNLGNLDAFKVVHKIDVQLLEGGGVTSFMKGPLWLLIIKFELNIDRDFLSLNSKKRFFITSNCNLIASLLDKV